MVEDILAPGYGSCFAVSTLGFHPLGLVFPLLIQQIASGR